MGHLVTTTLLAVTSAVAALLATVASAAVATGLEALLAATVATYRQSSASASETKLA